MLPQGAVEIQENATACGDDTCRRTAMRKFQKYFPVGFLLTASLACCATFADDRTTTDRYWGSDGAVVDSPLYQARRIDSYPDFLKSEIPGKTISVYSIDLDSDGHDDFIVQHNNAFRTCFVKYDNSRRSCEKLGVSDGFAYYWFAQLDNSPMLELFSMEGDEDWDDYWLYAFNPKTWARVKLLKIAPVIVARKNDSKYKGVYWGYPWDVRGLYLRKEGAKILIRAHLDFQRIQPEAGHLQLPAIYFDGLPTQGDPAGPFPGLVKHSSYLSLDTLVRKYGHGVGKAK